MRDAEMQIKAVPAETSLYWRKSYENMLIHLRVFSSIIDDQISFQILTEFRLPPGTCTGLA